MRSADPTTATLLLERDAELDQVHGALADARLGHGRVVLVEAPAGFGKTSLLRIAAAQAAEDGFTNLGARATELERDFAYGVVRQLLEPVIAKRSGPDSGRIFAGAADLARPLFVSSAEGRSSPWIDSSFSMLHGLYWLINNLTDEARVVMAVDDLQWADSASVRFLNFLAPRLDGLPLAVIVATRPEEGLSTDVARLATGPETSVIHLGPLSEGATAALCERRLGTGVTREFAAACREATGGNPFLLEALLADIGRRRVSPDASGAEHIRSIGPTAVARAVLVRLSSRPPDAMALIRAVAVLGDGASILEAALVAELPRDAGRRAADLLISLGLLRMARGLEFVHPIVREAIYEEMTGVERAEGHAHAAAMLTERRAPDERIAAQLLEAIPVGDPARVELLRRVARDALRRGAPAAAATWLERALLEPPASELMGELLVDLSSARLRLGRPEAAVEPLTTAVDLIDDPTLRVRAARLLGSALTWSGRADAAVAAMTAAMSAVEHRDRELGLLLEADRAAYAQQASLEARAPVAAALERHEGIRGVTPGERLLLAGRAFERARSSPTEREAVAHIEGILTDGQLVHEQALDVAGTLYLLVVALLATDALDTADACLSSMLAEARTRASIPAQAFVIEHRGWASYRRGDIAQAEADARLALELLTASDIELGRYHALALLIESLIEQGDIDAAEAALERYCGAGTIPPGMATNSLLEARSLLHLAQGRAGEGLDGLVLFGRYDESWGGANPLASRWRSQASIAMIALGDEVAARELAADDLARARSWGANTGIGIALRATALVDRGRDPINRLRESAMVLDSSPARLEQARVLIDLGAALRRANRRSEARRSLEKGLQIARRCDARALIETARTELRAAGGRSSDREGSGVDELTASERRVAELAAEGQSNPEIAQELFVTRKTVETHLGHVYQKLAISGRGKLARALAVRGSVKP